MRARHGGGKEAFPARIVRDRGDGTYDVDYDDGDKEKSVPRKLIHIKMWESDAGEDASEGNELAGKDGKGALKPVGRVGDGVGGGGIDAGDGAGDDWRCSWCGCGVESSTGTARKHRGPAGEATLCSADAQRYRVGLAGCSEQVLFAARAASPWSSVSVARPHLTLVPRREPEQNVPEPAHARVFCRPSRPPPSD